MGSTYCFSARTIGADLKIGPWGAESCTSVPLDDDALGAVGAWSHRADAAAYGGDYSQAGKRGATLTKSNLKASTLALVLTTCPGCGTVKVRWNGDVIATVPLDSPATVRSVVVPVATFAGVRTGDLKLTVKTSRRPVKIEGLGVGR